MARFSKRMGLDFATEGIPYEEDVPFAQRAHWSYTGFHYFRMRLAEAIGINLDSMEYFKEEGESWDAYKHHPLYAFLVHEDCEGDLSPQECARIAPIIEGIVSDWLTSDYDRIHAMRLVKHMRYCARTGRRLQFR
ncbi:MAG TPA: hypothetical protein VFO40_15565 [Chthoniobacterales bacterium]|nr:hypothetical protein [Chthoniobacterales bacterium]